MFIAEVIRATNFPFRGKDDTTFLTSTESIRSGSGSGRFRKRLKISARQAESIVGGVLDLLRDRK